MEWYLKVLREYANFNGRARRKEYWMFVLINFLITIVLYGITLAGAAMESGALASIGGGLVMLYALAVLIPSIAVAVRRLHDTGKSGAYYLLIFLPIIGPIWLLVLFATDSTPGPNQYGPNPKGIGNNEDESSHLIEEEA
jgi:uncharacterized membrane protein YhaH (DUF805 family)